MKTSVGVLTLLWSWITSVLQRSHDTLQCVYREVEQWVTKIFTKNNECSFWLLSLICLLFNLVVEEQLWVDKKWEETLVLRQWLGSEWSALVCRVSTHCHIIIISDHCSHETWVQVTRSPLLSSADHDLNETTQWLSTHSLLSNQAENRLK